jgi:predicted DNA-binding protein (MmcQ/YjbR family)
MNIEDLRDFCLSLKCVSESFPFNETVLVFKVLDKMFCLTDLDDDFAIAIKNEPEKIIQFREEFPAVKHAFNMSNKHWNSVQIDGSISDELIKTWIVESYNLVIKGMSKKKQQELKDKN